MATGLPNPAWLPGSPPALLLLSRRNASPILSHSTNNGTITITKYSGAGGAATSPARSMVNPMKKLLGIMAVSALTVSAFAQGTVVFQNDLTGLVRQWTTAADSTLIAATKGNAMVELITAPSGTPLPHPFGTLSAGFFPAYWSLESFLADNPGWTSQAVGGVNSDNGIFDNGTLSLTGIAAGASANYIIIGWTGTAPTLDEAIADIAWLGQSAVFTTATGDSSTPPGTPINLKDTFTGMTLAPEAELGPEPSMFALAGLGAVLLLLLRRHG